MNRLILNDGRTGVLLGLMFIIAVVGAHALSTIFVGADSALKSYLGFGAIVLFTSVFLLMLALWKWGPSSNDAADYRAFVLIGILIRLLLIPVDNFTSNDLGRYLFDGYIASIGLDPYRISHDAIELAQAREIWKPPAEHTSYVTLYPPLALALFSLASSAGPDWAELTWKFMLAAAGIISLLLMFKVLEGAGKLKHFALFAFSPILIFENGIGAHVDNFSVLAVCLILFFLQRNYLFLTGVAIGLGALVKLLPFVLLGPLVIALRSWVKPLPLVFGVFVTITAGYGIAFMLGMHPIGSLGVFFEKFRFGSPYFYFLEQSGLFSLSLDFIALLSVVLAGIGFAVVAMVIWRHTRPCLSDLTVKAMQATLAIPLLLTPVVYPWYLAPLIPLLAFAPNRFVLIWTALLPLTYEVLGGFACCQVWAPAVWPLVLVAFGFIVGVFPWISRNRA